MTIINSAKFYPESTCHGPFVPSATPSPPPLQAATELLYSADERPPLPTLAGLALQHVATALALIAYVLAAARIGQLDTATAQAMVTASILGMAVSTFLQSWGGRLGSGMLVIHMLDVCVAGLSFVEPPLRHVTGLGENGLQSGQRDGLTYLRLHFDH
jgi:xanthine permease XanP